MKLLRTALLSIGLCVALAAPAFAETELVMLRDGISGQAEILKTTPDSVSVRFKKGEANVETKLAASRLDPYSFYTIRRKHMEKTAENHVRLAIFCAEQGLFNQGRAEMKAARALDPEIETKIEGSPKIKEGIAQKLAAAAKKHFEAGELDAAHELVQIIATRLADTTLGPKVEEALAKIEAKRAEMEAEETAKRKKKAAMHADVKEKQAAEARENIIDPLERRQDSARKENGKGLRAGNSSSAKRHFETAGASLEKLLKAINAAKSKAGDDSELIAHLDDLHKECVSDAVNAYLNAANIELARENFRRVDEYAAKAEALAPDNKRVQSFKNTVVTAKLFAMDSDRRR